MNLMDGLLLTLVNAVVCIAFPKLLSLITEKQKPQTTLPKKSIVESQDSTSTISSYVDVTS